MTKRSARSSLSTASSRSGNSGEEEEDDQQTMLESLFEMSSADICDRLNAMLEAERRPHYRRKDYLRGRGRPDDASSSRAGLSRASGSRSRASCSRSRASSRRSKSRSRSSSCAGNNANDNDKAVTPDSRGRIVRWLYDCVDYLGLPRECVAVAMSYVDRFVSSNSGRRSAGGSGRGPPSASTSRKVRQLAASALQDATVYQLLSIASLLIASKQDSKLSSLDAPSLVRVSHGSYSAKEILDAESAILEGLGWRLCGPTSLGMACHAIAVLSKVVRSSSRSGGGNKRSNDRLASVADFARLQLELSQSDYASSCLVPASSLALASVLNSMELLDFSSKERRAFAAALSDRTGVDASSPKVEGARDALRRVFDRRSDGVAGRASPAAQAASRSSPGSSSSKLDRKKNRSFHSARSPVDVSDFSSARSRTGASSRRSGDRAIKGDRSRRRRSSCGRSRTSRADSSRRILDGRRVPLEP